jgi:hypothetical protein
VRSVILYQSLLISIGPANEVPHTMSMVPCT